MTKIYGRDAIEAYERGEVPALNKFADPIDGAMTDITIEFAREVASEDPELIWAESK